MTYICPKQQIHATAEITPADRLKNEYLTSLMWEEREARGESKNAHCAPVGLVAYPLIPSVAKERVIIQGRFQRENYARNHP